MRLALYCVFVSSFEAFASTKSFLLKFVDPFGEAFSADLVKSLARTVDDVTVNIMHFYPSIDLVDGLFIFLIF